jgi:predicted nucleotidyltransferase
VSVTDGRRREVESLLEVVRGWASLRADLRAVALVGSWAKRSARMESDVDLVLVTDDIAAYVRDDAWAAELGAAAVIRTRRRGALTERRLVLPSGLELDVGVVDPTWTSTAPLDPGTARVAADGLVPLHDPQGLLARLLAAVA